MLYNELFYPIKQKQNNLFTVRQAGKLNADKTYLIERSNSKTNVIAFVDAGCLHIKAENRTLTVMAGQSFFLPSQIKYTMYADSGKPPVMYWLNIRGDVFDSIVKSFQMGITVSNGTFKNIYPEIIALAGEERDNFNLIAEKMFGVLLFVRANEIIPSNDALDKSEQDMLEAYICNHIQDTFSVKQMSKDFNTSTDTVNRMFQKHYGITPYRYYQNMRIDFAKGFLEKSDLTIDDIAERLNFTDRNYFSLYFKKRTGQAPAEYRKSKH